MTFTAPPDLITARLQVWGAQLQKTVISQETTSRDLNYPLAFVPYYDEPIEAKSPQALLEKATAKYCPQLRAKLEELGLL